jgi:uncharacterized protein
MKQVDDYIESLPDTQREIAEKLREMLFELVNGIEERFSFKIPFYHYYGMFCYINAIPNGITLAFCRGKDLVLTFPQLVQEGRKIVSFLPLYKLSDIKKLEVRQVILAAADWNREAYINKVPMVSRKKKR